MNDPSGMMVLGVFSGEASALLNPAITSKLDRDGNRIEAYRMPATEHSKIMLVNAWDDRLTLHELVKRVEKTCRMLKVDLLLIENKASGISVAQEIRRLFSNEKFGVQLVDPKSQDKMARLISIQHLFEEGLVYAPSESYPWVERVIAQVGQFPKGKHDEFVDLISMGLRYLRGNGLISRAPEKEAEIEAQKAYRPREQPLYPA
jgi:predicted phage terminase large subunit-like protein